MFNGKGYSLSDIAAVSGGARNGDGFFGDGNGWWIILLFLFCGWGNGGGWGGGGNVGTSREISYGFDMNNLENTIESLLSFTNGKKYNTIYIFCIHRQNPC